MSHKKQFGIWMDKESATVVGRENVDEGDFQVLGHVKKEHVPSNSSEKNEHQHEQTVLAKYFKEIATHMQNAEVVHVTGIAEAQEQFIHFLKNTAQFKNIQATDSTSEKMSDEKLIEFFSGKFH